MVELQHFSPREAYAAYVRGGVMVDVRENKDVAEKSVAINHLIVLPMSELDKRFAEIPANRPVVLVSRFGNKGKEAARFLLQHGYTDVAVMDGGLSAWEEEGLPIRDNH